MIIKNVTGTVNDDLKRDAEQVRARVKHTGLRKILDNYLGDDSMPDLSIAFDEAVHYGSGVICSVSIPNDSKEATLLKPGDKVVCNFKPAGPGQASKLVAVSRL